MHSRFIENCIIPISLEFKNKKNCWKKKTSTQIHNQVHKHKQTTPPSPSLCSPYPHPLTGRWQHPVRTPRPSVHHPPTNQKVTHPHSRTQTQSGSRMKLGTHLCFSFCVCEGSVNEEWKWWVSWATQNKFFALKI